MDWILSAIRVATTLRLWLFVAIAGIGFAALYLPPFGGADLTLVRSYSWVAWLAAVAGTILSVAKIADSVVSAKQEAKRTQKARRRRADTNRYVWVYEPLMTQLSIMHINHYSTNGAPYLRQRLRNSINELRNRQGWNSRITRAWRAMFDRRVSRSGGMEFGGVFPIIFIREVIRKKTAYCDDRLIVLAKNAFENRIRSQLASDELSEDDCILMDHISDEHGRLKSHLGW